MLKGPAIQMNYCMIECHVIIKIIFHIRSENYTDLLVEIKDSWFCLSGIYVDIEVKDFNLGLISLELGFTASWYPFKLAAWYDSLMYVRNI